NSGTGVRHHQSGARIPSILAPRARQGARRVEPRDHGLEYEEDVRPQPRLTRPCAAWRRESRRLPVNRRDHNAIWTPPKVRRKLAEAKSSSAFCYKTSVRRAARAAFMDSATGEMQTMSGSAASARDAAVPDESPSPSASTITAWDPLAMAVAARYPRPRF